MRKPGSLEAIDRPPVLLELELCVGHPDDPRPDLLREPRATLDRQLVGRYVLHACRDDGIEVMEPLIRRHARDAVQQVPADVDEPGRPRRIDRLERLVLGFVQGQLEGRDAAGKGGTIKRIMEPMNPRGVRLVALGKPSDVERTQWFFQRYVEHLPAAGEIVIFDRSWYNRAGVERVMGFCTNEEYQEFMRSCPEYERMLVRAGIILVKYWFSVSDSEQERRFQSRLEDPAKLDRAIQLLEPIVRTITWS